MGISWSKPRRPFTEIAVQYLRLDTCIRFRSLDSPLLQGLPIGHNKTMDWISRKKLQMAHVTLVVSTNRRILIAFLVKRELEQLSPCVGTTYTVRLNTARRSGVIGSPFQMSLSRLIEPLLMD